MRFVCHKCGADMLPRPEANALSLVAYRDTAVISTGDVTGAREQLRKVENDISALDALVKSLKEAMAFASQEREELLLFINRHVVLLAPVRRLPAELLGQIFMDTPSDQRHELDTLTRLRLGWVCTKWRDIVITTPRMWSTIRIAPTLPREPILNSMLLRSVWIPRSAGALLDIDIASRGATGGLEWAMRALVPHSHRWRSFSFCAIRVDSEANAALLSTPMALPVLQSLEVDVGLSRYGYTSPLSAFVDAPALRKVYLGASLVDSEIELPWAQITTLEADMHLGMRRFQANLKRCWDLQFAIVTVRADDEGTSECVQHVPLRRWNLKFYRGDGKSIFDGVSFPNLHDLDLDLLDDVSDGDEPWGHTALISFINRSQCNICTFSVTDLYTTASCLLDVLSAMPTIETLMLRDPLIIDRNDGTRAFLTGLTYPSQSSAAETGPRPCVLPALRSLDLRFLIRDDEEEALIGMVWSRLRNETAHALLHVGQRRAGLEELFFIAVTDAMKAAKLKWQSLGLHMTRYKNCSR